jgi:peptidoglycan/LPS O-acetylase OafA/YrhL
VIQVREHQSHVLRSPWFYEATVSFAIGVACGGVCIPFLSYLIDGDPDPIGHGWPLCLQVSSLLTTFLVALRFHRTITLALGVYAGLVALMLGSGASEYPLASAIGLAIHGLLPALLGFAMATLLRVRNCPTVPANKSANKDNVTPGF